MLITSHFEGLSLDWECCTLRKSHSELKCLKELSVHTAVNAEKNTSCKTRILHHSISCSNNYVFNFVAGFYVLILYFNKK